jgi:glyoxylase-like metal-dependent hydrolase (beta-lactamase superfamily II)
VHALLLALILAAPPAPETRGRAILTAALDALGGKEKISALDSFILEGAGRENLSAELQGLSPDAPTWRPHEEKIAVIPSTGQVAWQRRTPRNDLSLRWRRFIYGPDAHGVVDFFAGWGAVRPGGTPEPERRALMRRVPHLLLLEAATHATRVEAKGERVLDGSAHDAVDVELEDAGTLTLLLSKKPVALGAVEYRYYMPGAGDCTVRWRFRGWKADAALGLVPSGHVIEVNGTTYQEVTYSRFQAGASEAAEMMKVPADLKPAVSAPGAPSPPAGPATGEIAPGVHALEIRGFLFTFVELGDELLVFDPPATYAGLESIPASGWRDAERVTEDARAEIEKTGKRVRWVVVSHHHGDHLGGLRAFAGKGVTVLAAPSHVAAVKRTLAAPHALAPDGWTGAQDASVEPVAKSRTLSGGGRRVEVVGVGENPHTKESLFLWLPAEKIVLQGDLFYYEEGAPFPPAGRETMDVFFARWLEEHHMEPKAIYGVHDRGAAGADALRRVRQGIRGSSSQDSRSARETRSETPTIAAHFVK